MNDDHWQRIRLTIIAGLAAVSLGIFLGIHIGATGTLQHCGVIAAGGR